MKRVSGMYHMAMGDTVECEYLLKNTLLAAASVLSPLVPGRCSECRDPSLEYPHEEGEGVLLYYHKIYERKEDASVDDQAHYHGDHVHAQLPGHHLQVRDGDDLSTDEAGDSKGGVPSGRHEMIALLCYGCRYTFTVF